MVFKNIDKKIMQEERDKQDGESPESAHFGRVSGSGFLGIYAFDRAFSGVFSGSGGLGCDTLSKRERLPAAGAG